MPARMVCMVSVTSQHFLGMRQRFRDFFEAEDPIVAANSILMAIDRACALISRMIDAVGEEFRNEGGFTERLSAARLEKRDEQVQAEDVPLCPKCGAPMQKRFAKKGRNAGNPFWSCIKWPECNGTRKC